jgi:excisionase family DNA binding protein
MENHTDHPLTLTVEQAAKLLGIGRSTAYELVHTGDIPSLRLGRRIVVPRTRLAALLAAANPAHGHATTAAESHEYRASSDAEEVESPTLF